MERIMNLMTVNSKGQISIPAKVRKKMNLSPWDKLSRVVSGDTLVVKKSKIPILCRARKASCAAQKWAETTGLKEEDIAEAIKDVRSANKQSCDL